MKCTDNTFVADASVVTVFQKLSKNQMKHFYLAVQSSNSKILDKDSIFTK